MMKFFPRLSCVSPLALRQGFTVAETVLVVTVLAILIGMSFPAITRYLVQRDMQMEENRMVEIRNGLRAYLLDKNKAPGLTTWATELATGGYVSLTPSQTQTDIWGKARVFRSYTDTTRSIMGNSVPVIYISVHSRGPDGLVEETEGVGRNAGGGYAGTGWWSDAGLTVEEVIEGFSKLKGAGDDALLKVTDYTDKMNNYELTNQRIDRIVDALESYARQLYSKDVAACAAMPQDADGLTGDALCDTPGALEAINYFPRAKPVTALEGTPDAQWNYKDSGIVVDNTKALAGRRDDMKNLMRTLGLPVDYCCSAIGVATDGAPEPFYYFSNPRQRNADGTTCKARPTSSAARLSPRVVTKNVPDGTPAATCG